MIRDLAGLAWAILGHSFEDKADLLLGLLAAAAVAGLALAGVVARESWRLL